MNQQCNILTPLRQKGMGRDGEGRDEEKKKIKKRQLC